MEPGESSSAGGGAPQDASKRHMQTEKRRRDRIASGFESLRELIPCKDRKLDKATFLQEVVDYVGSLQDAVQQTVALGGIQSLPEETQWQIRLLLPRQANKGRGAAGASGRGADAESPSQLRQPSAREGLQAEQAGPSAAQLPDVAREQGAVGGAAALETDARVLQLQHLLRQLQSQQASNAQQFQLQQAALMRSQMLGAMQHLAQQPAPRSTGRPPGALLQADALQSQQLGFMPLAAPPLAQPPEGQAGLGVEVPCRDGGGGAGPPAAAAAAAMERCLPKPRKAQKVRRHTTAARMSNPHSNPQSSSGSESGNSGRPDRAPAEPSATNEPSSS